MFESDCLLQFILSYHFYLPHYLDTERGNLWSSSNGLPTDFEEGSDSTSKSVPASFQLLLDELRSDSSDDTAAVLDPTERALCILVARCIRCQGATSLVLELVERNGRIRSTVEVLAIILSDAQGTTDHQKLSTIAGSAFLDCVESSLHAQRKLASSPGLLRALPISQVVPRLISIANSSIDNCDLMRAVSTAITWIMVACLPNHVEEVVQEVVKALGSCDNDVPTSAQNDHSQSGTKLNESRSSKVCRKVTGGWRRELLTSPACGIHGLASVLSAIASAMFAEPSSSVPLELLGNVVGDELVLADSEEKVKFRIWFAVMAVLKQSLGGLDKAEGTSGEAKGSASIYSRLSPLLLLRRIPSGYYKVIWRSSFDDRDEMELLLSQLVKQIADRLGIPPLSSSSKQDTFSAEERQLAAEIAGRCLPFYDQTSPSCCCYQRICYPSFTSALRVLKVSHDEEESTSPIESLRSARVSLYACCTHIPLAEDDEDGEGVFGTVSFVLEVLNVDVAEVIRRNVAEDDLIQLQTGCIEFLAACLESTLQRQVKNQYGKSNAAVVEVIAPSTTLAKQTIGDCSVSIKDALATSCSAIASTLRAGSPIPCQLRLSNNRFISDSSNDSKKELSTSARTCTWNAFLIVSQRCPDDGRLNSWANMTAPWILGWASAGPIDDNLRHPLCMAAALQILFILVTRTKSFDCLAGGKTTTTSVRKAHRLAIMSIKTKTNIGGDYARITMRRAALKLLLALVTIDQMDSTGDLAGCLSPGELGETFTLLNGTANVDTDTEVRNLAAHILAGMRAS